MKFQKHVNREVRDFLTQQLREYERETKMTKEERRLLHEWVASGRSPYENGDYIYGAGGPVDFISALRTTQEMADWFASLSEEEKQAEMQNPCVQYDPQTEDIIINMNALNLHNIPDDELPFQ